MHPFFEKEEFTQADIETIVRNQFEENIHLEFKRGDALKKSDGAKTEIAKDISSFANSDGGVLIYGIAEKDNVASAIIPVDGNEFSREWLEQVIRAHVQQSINDLRIIPIQLNNDLRQTVFIVKIPVSYQAPHMASDGRFYRRHNFMAVRMEEYEVRELYNRKTKTELELIELQPILGGFLTMESKYDFYTTLRIINTSKAIEERYKLEIRLPSQFLHGVSAMFRDHPHYIDQGYAVFTIPNKSPLFQGEEVQHTLTYEIRRHSFASLKEAKLTIRLYYSNGVKETIYNMFDLSRNDKNELLTEASFSPRS